MIGPGEARRELGRTLSAAYADGLLSQETLSGRVEELFKRRLIDPALLVGDLSFRARRQTWRARLADVGTAVRARCSRTPLEPEFLLALDWVGEPPEVMVGRHYECDVVLPDSSVSRRHARLVFRDGGWVIQDLGSTNGTTVNGVQVGRCALQPGDQLRLGSQRLRVD